MTSGTVAIIPARGGSVGIPRKNLMTVGDETLIGRAVRSARAAQSIDRVVVTTDDAEIRDEARRAGAFVVDRPAALATSTASSESALLHALDVLDRSFELVAFLQATSPFIDPADLDAAVERVRAGEADVVFSAIPTPVFLWAPGPGGGWHGVNHDAAVRVRRQDLDPQVAETGAFYVMRTAGLLGARHRFFGRVEPHLVDERFSIDIDTEVELEIARVLAARQPAPVTVTAPRQPAPHQTAPHQTAPHQTAPHQTAPHPTAPHQTTPHQTTPHPTTPHPAEEPLS